MLLSDTADVMPRHFFDEDDEEDKTKRWQKFYIILHLSKFLNFNN